MHVQVRVLNEGIFLTFDGFFFFFLFDLFYTTNVSYSFKFTLFGHILYFYIYFY